MDDALGALKRRLHRGGPVSIFEVLRQFQLDFLMKAAFSQEPRFLKTGEETKSYSFQARFFHWFRWQGLPYVEYLLYQTWIANLLRRGRKPKWAAMAAETLRNRLQGGDKREKKDLLDKYMDAGKAHPEFFGEETLLMMVTSTISAGFDTSAYTMAHILFYLLKNPDQFSRLRQEIQDDAPKWTEVNKLTYLDAIMKEAMRLSPALNLPLERIVPASGLVINGFHLPANTTVGCHSGILGHNRDFYGSDAHLFRPERWLDKTRQIALERANLTFGSGKRICLGMHIAEMEIKKAIPALVREFEVSVAANMILEG